MVYRAVAGKIIITIHQSFTDEIAMNHGHLEATNIPYSFPIKSPKIPLYYMMIPFLSFQIHIIIMYNPSKLTPSIH